MIMLGIFCLQVHQNSSKQLRITGDSFEVLTSKFSFLFLFFFKTTKVIYLYQMDPLFHKLSYVLNLGGWEDSERVGWDSN